MKSLFRKRCKADTIQPDTEKPTEERIRITRCRNHYAVEADGYAVILIFDDGEVCIGRRWLREAGIKGPITIEESFCDRLYTIPADGELPKYLEKTQHEVDIN